MTTELLATAEDRSTLVIMVMKPGDATTELALDEMVLLTDETLGGCVLGHAGCSRTQGVE